MCLWIDLTKHGELKPSIFQDTVSLLNCSSFSFLSSGRVFFVFLEFLFVFLSVIRDELRARARASRSAVCFFFSSGREELVTAPVRLAGSLRILVWTFFMNVKAGLFPTVTGYLPSVTGSFPSVTYFLGCALRTNPPSVKRCAGR